MSRCRFYLYFYMERKLILITNDDGYEAQGVNVLADLMAPLGDVVMVAPEGARSGAACSITPTRPINLYFIDERPGIRRYACTGTPVDCVKLAVERVCERIPDLVVSGINHGDNASCSLHYSGTMGAVFEACMKSIPAIGFSLRTLSHQCDFSPYAPEIVRISQYVIKNGLPQDVCLNVNFPEVEQLAGTTICRMGRGRWIHEWAPAHNPRGFDAYWLTGEFSNLEPDSADTDYWALDHGYAAVTPIKLDMTDYESMKLLSGLSRSPGFSESSELSKL